MGELNDHASPAERFAGIFEGFAAQLAESSGEFLSSGVVHKTGGAIYHAWLNELLTTAPAIQKVIGWVVENPPPAETKKASRLLRASKRLPSSQQAMMEEGIFTAVFNLLHSSGEIETGRVGGEQLCRRLARVVRETSDTKVGPPKGGDSAKRSTVKSGGESKALIIAALNGHHQYCNGACEDVGHVGVNKLARYLKLSPSTISGFFKTEFGGHDKYRIACGNLENLAYSLKMLNGELRPSILFNPLGDNAGNLADE